MAKNRRGILISLIKRAQNLKKNPSDESRFIVFGHYDEMDIKPTKQWADFRPAEVHDVNSKEKINLYNGIADKYTIKACCASASMGVNIDYSTWEKGIFDAEYPFISCIMLHLTKECIAKNGAGNIFQEVVAHIEKLFCDIKYSIYFSIGYADVIVLVRSKNFNSTSRIITQLNSLQNSRGEKWVSDLYTITGFDKHVFSSCEDIVKAQRDAVINCSMQFSISFGLKAGFSFKNFKKELLSAMESVFVKIGYSYSEEDLGQCLWTSFGNIDVIFNVKLPAAVFPALYSDKLCGPFATCSKIFQKYINTIKVSVLNDYEEDKEYLCKKEQFNELPGESYNEFCEEFKEFVKEQHFPKRLLSSIMQIIKSYSSLAEQPHGFDVQHIIAKVMEAFIANMRLAMQKLKEKKDEERGMFIDDIEKAIGKFRGYIVTYLSDLHRSERSFIEGRTMTHPSIGALTKLLFSYNVFINTLAKQNNTENVPYAFLIVSGGCDQTQLEEIFGFLGAWEPSYYHLFIVSIPEVSLFDISGSLFRLSHECLHGFGERQRQKRIRYALYAWANYIAESISEKLFNPALYKLSELKLERKAVQKIDASIEHGREEFSAEFKQYIKEQIDAACESMDVEKQSLYAVNCISIIKEVMEYLFVVDSLIVSPLYKKTVNCLLVKQTDIFRVILNEVREQSHTVEILRDMLGEMEIYYEQQVEPKDMDSLSTNMLQSLFSSVNSAMHAISADRLYSEAYSRHAEWNVTSQLDDDLCGVLENFGEVVVKVMSECFADCKAAKILDVSLESFLFAFAYETRDVDKAMPFNITHILRLGVDLKLLYGVSGKFLPEHQKKLRELLVNYNGANFDVQFNVEQYIERIDQILQIYWRLQTAGDEIIQYLNQCGIDKHQCSPEMNQIYQKFQNPHAISSDSVYAFLEYWRRLAGDSLCTK